MTTRREFMVGSTKTITSLGVASLFSSRAASGASRKGTGLVFKERYLEHRLGPRSGHPHPESPLRLTKILEVLKSRGLDQELTEIEPLLDPLLHIRRHHRPEHVDAVRKLEVTGAVAELAVAGALGAVDAVARGDVRNAFCAVRPPGHHANNTGREEGFCYFSNAAIAAKYAQSVHGFRKVLIIDWDYHHGNATQNAFYADPTVLFFSTHDFQAYPGTGDPRLEGEGEGTGLNINVHLGCGARDADMLRSWDQKLLPAVARFRPEFVIISAGFDSRKDDLLGCFEVTDDAFRRMTRTAMDVAGDYCQGRVVSMLEGGYNVDGLARAAAAHVETLLGGP
jgi:acetoin utilization deacetylase AcuC-like enzyme